MKRWLPILFLVSVMNLFATDDLERFGRGVVSALKAGNFERFAGLMLNAEDIPPLFDDLHASEEWKTMTSDDRKMAEEELRALQTALVEPDSESRKRLQKAWESMRVRGENLYHFQWPLIGYTGMVEGREWSMLGLTLYDGLVVLFEANGKEYRLAFGRLIRTQRGWCLGPDGAVELVVN